MLAYTISGFLNYYSKIYPKYGTIMKPCLPILSNFGVP